MDELHTITRIGDALEELAEHGPLTPRERIELWVSLHEMGSAWRAVLRQLEEDALDAALELNGGDRKVPVRTRFATVAVKRKPGAQRVNGYQLLAAMGSRYADPATGELELAVPVRLLRGTLPACSIDDYSSARFNLTALRGARLQVQGRDVELDEFVQTGAWSETITIVGEGEDRL